ncbi:hypothetical protein FRC02_002688 [Tulasnella sp. 418]|nr:hypothetical protein FRC02_002688 [Tulasnella sp. 418]
MTPVSLDDPNGSRQNLYPPNINSNGQAGTSRSHSSRNDPNQTARSRTVTTKSAFDDDDVEANHAHNRDDTQYTAATNLPKGPTRDRPRSIIQRFKGEDRDTPLPGWRESFIATLTSSWLNYFLIFLPLSWLFHFLYSIHHKGSPNLTFIFSVLGIIPLEKLFDFLGEQLALYCGQSIGDLIVITLNNAVEATLAIILLTKCELRLLQSTIIGVVLIHLLLVPGFAFLTGGAKVWQQHLHEHPTQLNHVLLTFGVMSFLIPAAVFAALGTNSTGTTQAAASASNHGGEGASEATTVATEAAHRLLKRAVPDLSFVPAVSDETRGVFLQISRGLAIMLLIVYIGSRIYLHNPPGDGNAFTVPAAAPQREKKEEQRTEQEAPKVNPWACIVFLVVTVGIMAATAEWLVKSLEYVVKGKSITEEWFGLVLLPMVSFAGDGLVGVVYFVETLLQMSPPPPQEIAKGRSIDLSIQFTLFWAPFFVLIAWWTHKPMSLLFDLFEVAVIIGSCFLVNYVTQDAKTNWAEGLVLVTYYVMIALVAFFYPGQQTHRHLLACGTSVAESVATGGESFTGAAH